MNKPPLAGAVSRRLRHAAQQLGVDDPTVYVGPLIQRTFALPEGDARYGANALTPGAAPLEPSYSEEEPDSLRFTIEPLGPEASPTARRDEATREMRRLVGPIFGKDALNWFDQRSEEWRGRGSGRLNYGAFFGTSYDANGLRSSKIYYEMNPGEVAALPSDLAELVHTARSIMPPLWPLFTSITCRAESGHQRTTFLHRGPMRLAHLGPLMEHLGLGHRLPGLMQLFGVALGGRFEFPEQSVLLSLGHTERGPELELYVLLGMLPDLPPSFLNLLTLGLAERPRELRALARWLHALTPERENWPGNFSILSVRTTPVDAPRLSLYLRPVEFELRRNLDDVPELRLEKEGEEENEEEETAAVA